MVSLGGLSVFSLVDLEAAIDHLLALTPAPPSVDIVLAPDIVPLLMIAPLHSISICMIFIMSVPFSLCLGRV